MSLFDELKNRRFVQIVAGYAGVGWLALQVPDQLADRGVVPEWVYVAALVWYAGGLVAAAVIGWFHGEKGRQQFSKPEIAVLGLVGVVTLLASAKVVSDSRAALAPVTADMAEGGMDLRRLAVLYFEDRSRDGEFQYLADGLTEGLISALSPVSGIDVVSRNGSAQYRDSGLASDSIARLLDAGSFVHGSVEATEADVRVEVALFDSESGVSVQRRSFERPASDLQLIQDDLSQEVAELLRAWLGEEIRVRQRQAASANPAAWVLLQRAERASKDAGSFLSDGHLDEAAEAYARADELLAQAEDLDATWAAPTVHRARVAYELSRLEHDPASADRLMDRSMGHLERALQRDGDDADALELRGTIKYVRWILGLEPDPQQAARLLESAEQDLVASTRNNPLQANAWNVLAHYYYQKDDILEANNAARRAYEADAYLAAADDVLWRLWSTSYDLEVFPQARRWCETGRERFPDNPRFYECGLWNMTSRAADPDPGRAWELLDDVLDRTAEQDRELTRLQMQILVAGALARAQLSDSARVVLDGSRGNPGIDPTRELDLTQAFVHTLLGDADAAVDLLASYLAANPERREGFAEHGHWWWRDLRSNSRFEQLVGQAR